MYWSNVLIFSFVSSNVFAAAVDAQLQQLGFSGITTWTYVLIGIAGGIALSLAVTDKVKQGTSHISSDSSLNSTSNSNLKPRRRNIEKSNYVSHAYRMPVVYRANYELPAQVYRGISLQFDWSSLEWNYATRGYYRKSPNKYSSFSLSNHKFSARVFDFNTGMWRYELRENIKSKKSKAKKAESKNTSFVAYSTNKENLVQHSGGYVNVVTGEFFSQEDITSNTKRNDFNDKPSSSVDIDEVNMLFASAAAESF